MSTTHPIKADAIENTQVAETIFDGISYGKGGAFLKQMYKVTGHETYKKGLHRYFQLYAWKNTILDNFVDCIAWAYNESGDTSMGPNFNFKAWCDKWLNSSGVNILEPEVEYNDDGSVKTFAIK